MKKNYEYITFETKIQVHFALFPVECDGAASGLHWLWFICVLQAYRKMIGELWRAEAR